MTRLRDFTEGNATKQILFFALPMLIGNVFQQVYSMVDTLVVGRFVSGTALAAVGTSSSILNFLVGVLIGMTTGASVVISQLYGAKQEEKLHRAVSTSILFLAVLSVVMSAIGVIFSPAILRLLATPADMFDDAVLYLRVLMAGLLFPIFYNMYTAYLRALGDSRSPLFFLILSTILNMGLDLFFVLRWNMGVAGVALATVIAQTVAAVSCYLFARRYVPLLRVTKWVFDRGLLKAILKYSIPAALQLSLTSLASLTIMRLINSFGSVAVAGYTAATKIDQLTIMPLSNLSMAISTFVGQNMGAGLEERAKKGFRSTTAMMVAVGIALSAVIILLGRTLITLFLDAQEPNFSEIVGVGTQYLSVLVMFYFLFGIFFAFCGFFRGAGDAVIVMILTIASLTIRAVFAHVFVNQLGMGVDGIAWSIPIGWGICTTASYIYYKRGLWRGKVVTASAEPEPSQC